MGTLLREVPICIHTKPVSKGLNGCGRVYRCCLKPLSLQGPYSLEQGFSTIFQRLSGL